ncbi:AAA family ATPase [Colwellia demingiae]|uniref:AAA family ATPase n=1 Tax=Colwellia demingiae TaxID=89401 RepID=A0A5C6QEJ3_9GAMM|nr:AAA family ATPase [Colwellia demingiae]TWX67150.1 AAA family ATPase [Colwellia demingiae]
MMQTGYEADLTVRITKIFTSTKKTKDYILFSAVSVHKTEHRVLSKIDYYTIKAPDTISPDPHEGEIWSIKGNASYEETPSFDGKYYIKKHHVNVVKAELILSKNPIGFKSFIADTPHFKGIGLSTAEKLWQEFGENIYQILENKDLAKLMTLKGLGKISAVALITGFEQFSYLKYSKFFTEHDIPVAIQKRIYKFNGVTDGSLVKKEDIEFDPDPTVLIKSNPYSLSTFGMDFKLNDRIAKVHFDITDCDTRRLVAAVVEVMRKHASKGHTVAHRSQLIKPLKEMLGSDDLASKALEGGYDKKAFIIYPKSGMYQFTSTYIMENTVVKRLLKLHELGEIYDEVEDAACISAFQSVPFNLEPQQREAVMTSISYAISCITGGAGTGKTTVLNTVLNAYEEIGYKIKAVALSGRAAMRMRQSIRRPCSTIAKFLREDAIEDVADNKFLLVIDESSMIDLPTIFKIATHIAPEVRILFVGDPNQLPPIGAGKILADIVKSRLIHNTELSIVKRQGASSGIPEYSKLINEGVIPPKLTTGAITFHDTGFEFVVDKCVELYHQAPENSRVVTPTNALVDKINAKCQLELNPNGKRIEYERDGQHYRDNLYQNDPVLFTQNNYDVGVQNGSLGKLISVEQDGSILGEVQMDDFEDEESEFVSLTESLLYTLKAGYAITLHKAQGSQFPRVIVALSGGSNLDRAWLYTAITRAEEEIHIVGPKEKLISAIKTQSNASKRQTYLQELLKI